MKMSESTQLLSHRNRSHTTELFLRLNKLRKEEVLCDLTILVQGQKFKVRLSINFFVDQASNYAQLTRRKMQSMLTVVKKIDCLI